MKKKITPLRNVLNKHKYIKRQLAVSCQCPSLTVTLLVHVAYSLTHAIPTAIYETEIDLFTIIGVSIKNESYQNNCDPCYIITTLAIPTTMFRGNWFVENESYQNTCGPCCKIITHTIPTNMFRRNWFVYYYRSVDQKLILSKHLHLDFPLVWLHTED